MSVPPFVFPGLVILFTFLAGIGILFICIRCAICVRKSISSEIRNSVVSSRFRSFLMIILSWPTLILSLFSFTALGVVSCRIGFYPTTSAPLNASVVVTDTFDMDQSDGLVKLSARDGSVNWIHTLPTANNSLLDGSGNVADELGNVMYVHGWLYKDRVHFPSGVISAYRASDGALLWSAPSLSQQTSVQSFPIYVSDPIVVNGMIYALGNSAVGASAIYALRAKNGTIAWSVPLPHGKFLSLDQTGANGYFMFTVGSGLLVTFAQDGDISAWHASDGSAAWHVTASVLSVDKAPYYPPTLLIANQTLYIVKNVLSANTSISAQSLLLALRASNGQVLWHYDFSPNSIGTSLARFGTHLYLDAYNMLYTLDATNGALLWQRHFGDAVAPVEVDNRVYVFGVGSLYALWANNGNQIWSHVFKSSGGSTLQIVSSNVLLVATAPDHYAGLWNFCPGDTEPYRALFAFNARDGSIYWRHALSTW
jgi:outer membrane protein assembly factor BamB